MSYRRPGPSHRGHGADEDVRRSPEMFESILLPTDGSVFSAVADYATHGARVFSSTLLGLHVVNAKTIMNSQMSGDFGFAVYVDDYPARIENELKRRGEVPVLMTR